jgi:hypothetical protein
MITRTPLRDDPHAIPTAAGLQCQWQNDAAVDEAMPILHNVARIVARIVDRTQVQSRTDAVDEAA